MKNLLRVLTILVLLTAYSFIVESCCIICCDDEGGLYRIADIREIRVFDLEESFETDTIRGAFVLQPVPELETAYQFKNLSLMTSAYGTSCNDYPTYVNWIVEGSLKLHCDKDFIYDGNTITADADYVGIVGTDIEIDDFGETTFTQDFIDAAVFQNTDYTFKIEMETDDGLNLMGEKTLIIDL